MISRDRAKFGFRNAFFLFAGIAVVTSTACLKQHSVDRPDRSTHLQIKPSERVSTFDPIVIADRVAKRYAHEKYISFEDHILNHESIAPGWLLKPGGGIAKGTVFDVVMSAEGNIRAQLYVDKRLIYEARTTVPKHARVSGDGSKYYLQEIDYRNGVRSDPVECERGKVCGKLSAEALDHASWCAGGGTTTTFVGALGRVADFNNEDSFAYQIARGQFDRQEVSPDGRRLIVFRFVQQEAAGPGKGPQGQDLPARPKIWWDIYVDSESDLIVQKDGFFEKPGEKPVLVRRAKYTDIQFPTHIDEEAVFRSIPEVAKSYRVWKPDQPYPGTKFGM